MKPTLTLPLSLTALVSAALAIVAQLLGYDTVAAIAGVLLLLAVGLLPVTWRD